MHLEGAVEHLHDVDDMRRLSDEFMRVTRAQNAIRCISLLTVSATPRTEIPGGLAAWK